jgi:hypothetical protein
MKSAVRIVGPYALLAGGVNAWNHATLAGPAIGSATVHPARARPRSVAASAAVDSRLGSGRGSCHVPVAIRSGHDSPLTRGRSRGLSAPVPLALVTMAPSGTQPGSTVGWCDSGWMRARVVPCNRGLRSHLSVTIHSSSPGDPITPWTQPFRGRALVISISARPRSSTERSVVSERTSSRHGDHLHALPMPIKTT